MTTLPRYVGIDVATGLPWLLSPSASPSWRCRGESAERRGRIDKVARMGRARPYSHDEIERARAVSPTAATGMETANARAKKATPALAIYDTPQPTARERQGPRLTVWENRHRGRRSVNPTAHARERRKFVEEHRSG